MSIALGSMAGGHHDGMMSINDAKRRIDDVIHRLLPTSQVADSPPVLVVFHFPGHLDTPDHVGASKPRFSGKRGAVAIAFGFSDAMMRTVQPVPLILDSLREAIRLASPVFAKHGLKFSVESHLAFLDDVQRTVDLTEA